MRSLLLFAALALSCAGSAGGAPDRSALVADALDWYSVWFGGVKRQAPGVQKCRGELRENSYIFRCDPLSVVVGVGTDEAGRCWIKFMGPSIGPDDGLQMLTPGNWAKAIPRNMPMRHV